MRSGTLLGGGACLARARACAKRSGSVRIKSLTALFLVFKKWRCRWDSQKEVVLAQPYLAQPREDNASRSLSRFPASPRFPAPLPARLSPSRTGARTVQASSRVARPSLEPAAGREKDGQVCVVVGVMGMGHFWQGLSRVV
jgi:hypothetical protein